MPDLSTFGYRPDPPNAADRSFSGMLRPKLVADTAGDVDLRIHTTQTNQYSASSCVGNATADSVEILNSVSGLPSVQLSRLFVYTLCRNLMDTDLDGRADIDKDEGTYIRLAFDVLSKFGICREDLPSEQGGWPYDLKKLHTLPSLKAMRSATGHRIHSYYRIYETGDERVERIIEALRSSHPVVFGTLIDDSFTQLTNEGPADTPKGDTRGGHAMICVGYERAKGFIIKNSWGLNWGDGGFCYMTPEYLGWRNTTDLWVPTKGAMFR